MPAPRISHSAESARAAALQAEFNEKKWVWVPDEKEGYLAGWVVKEEDDFGDIIMAAGGEVRSIYGMHAELRLSISTDPKAAIVRIVQDEPT